MQELSQGMLAFLEKNMELLRMIAAWRTPLLDTIFAAITHLGEETLTMAILFFVFWCVDKRRGYYLMMLSFGGVVVSLMLKIVLCIPRPWVLDPEFRIVEAAREQAIGYSFPSGHTQNIIDVFGGFAKMDRRRWVKLLCILIAAAVSFSRLYLGVHTPFDVGVSVVTASAMIFALAPVFRAPNRNLIGAWAAVIAIAFAFLLFAQLRLNSALLVPSLSAEDLKNFSDAVKGGNCMLGASIGALICYLFDEKLIHFETKAAWWAQLLKTVLGLVLVVAVKAVLKTPLYTCFGASGDIVRYGVMVLAAGLVWPLSFRFFSHLGGRKSTAKS